MPLQSGTPLGVYRIVGPLGAGGMGEVYRATDTRLNREVAIKVVPASLASDTSRLMRFEQEARATSALNHPNIVTIHELGEVEAGHFIVMELVEGRTLRALIDEGLSFDALAQLGGQMAKALRAAHAAGITHRDIKPENIMVRNDGYVKVLDFGLARLVPATMDREAETLQYTQPGTILGSIQYMSPEQARGESVSYPSDIFSLGMIFYEMATGRHPFATDSILGTLNAINLQAPVAPSRLNPEIPTAIEMLILQMLQKDARLRPTAAEVEAALSEIAGKGSGEFRSPLLRARTRRTVGREKAHAELHECLASVFAGKGLLVCVPGEPGMGKTTLVEDFLSDLRAGGPSCVIARGRCSERLAGTEAYLPWLEALDGLLRGSDGQSRISAYGSESIAQTTKRLAPTWYAQAMPLQPDDSSVERLLAERAASQERMKREFGALLEEISERRPLVLFFDDIHWADVSTIDLLAYLASKFDSMRVLVIATYRPSDLLLAKHPFLQVKPDLQARGLCREIELEFLSRSEIEKYLALEFPEHRFPAELPELIHSKTEGNPLFMADLVRYLRDRRVIAEEHGQWMLAQSLPEVGRDLPESVRGMIERKIAQLSEEDRRLLVAASVQGYEFDSAIVAKALELDPADVEERLEGLERVYALVRFVTETEFPIGRVLTLRYRFVHVLYQNALYASLRPTRRAQLSATVAEALLACYGKQSKTVASELAFLFETARDWARATEYYLVAANNASGVFALQEAGALAQRGLEVLNLLPETPECAKQELALQTMLGQSLMVAKGYALPEVEQAFIRARELSLKLNDIPQLFRAQFSLAIVYVVRAEYQRAFDHGEQCLRLGEETRHKPLIMQSHWVIGLSQCYLGQFTAARDHFEKTIAIHDAARIDSTASIYGGVLSRAHLARILLYLGYPDQSRQVMNEAIARAKPMRFGVAAANTLALAAYAEAYHHNVDKTLELAAEMAWYGDEHGLPYYAAVAILMRGWALAMRNPEEGIALIREGLASYLAIGTKQQHGYFLSLLADALSRNGQEKEELEALEEAIEVAKQNNEPYYDAELYRLRGDALVKAGLVPTSEAEWCFRRAIEISRQQQAKSFELRAAVSLARLLRQQGNSEGARTMLAEIYGWFTEGFDTPDITHARVLLDELSGSGPPAR